MKRLENGTRIELEKAVMRFLSDRDYEATRWDVVCFISGYEPDCTAEEAIEIVHWMMNRGIEIQF